jgi:hypothetical protein
MLLIRLGRQQVRAHGGVTKAVFAILLAGAEVALQEWGLGVAAQDEDVGGNAVQK